jgi:hypothetical protein
LLAHGRWFSPGTLASFTTKTGPHDITEILLNVALKHNKSIDHILLAETIYTPFQNGHFLPPATFGKQFTEENG